MKCILVLSHGNADPERGFSINKRLIDIHGPNIQEETIEAVRLVKDFLIQLGGLENLVINKQLIQMCSDAHLRYKSEQDLKRKQEEKEQAEKEKAKREEATAIKKREKSDEIASEIKLLKTAISVAEQSVTEGNLEFQACMRCTSLNRKKLEQAQAKIDMGLKRQSSLELELAVLEKRKKK